MSNPVSSSDKLNVHLKSSAYRQKGGGDIIKYLFISEPTIKEGVKGEGGEFG